MIGNYAIFTDTDVIPKPKWSYQPSRIHVRPHPGAHRAHLSVCFGGELGQGCTISSVLVHQ